MVVPLDIDDYVMGKVRTLLVAVLLTYWLPQFGANWRGVWILFVQISPAPAVCYVDYYWS